MHLIGANNLRGSVYMVREKGSKCVVSLDMEAGIVNDFMAITPPMLKFKGAVGTVIEVHPLAPAYKLDVDGGQFWWGEAVLEDVPDIQVRRVPLPELENVIGMSEGFVSVNIGGVAHVLDFVTGETVEVDTDGDAFTFADAVKVGIEELQARQAPPAEPGRQLSVKVGGISKSYGVMGSNKTELPEGITVKVGDLVVADSGTGLSTHVVIYHPEHGLCLNGWANPLHKLSSMRRGYVVKQVILDSEHVTTEVLQGALKTQSYVIIEKA